MHLVLQVNLPPPTTQCPLNLATRLPPVTARWDTVSKKCCAVGTSEQLLRRSCAFQGCIICRVAVTARSALLARQWYGYTGTAPSAALSSLLFPSACRCVQNFQGQRVLPLGHQVQGRARHPDKQTERRVLRRR